MCHFHFVTGGQFARLPHTIPSMVQEEALTLVVGGIGVLVPDITRQLRKCWSFISQQNFFNVAENKIETHIEILLTQ